MILRPPRPQIRIFLGFLKEVVLFSAGDVMEFRVGFSHHRKASGPHAMIGNMVQKTLALAAAINNLFARSDDKLQENI